MAQFKKTLEEIKLHQDIIQARLDDHFSQDEKNMEKINEELDKMNAHLSDYNADLRVHIAGTIQNREAIHELKEANKIFQEELKALQELAITLRATWSTIVKTAIVVSTVTGILVKLIPVLF